MKILVIEDDKDISELITYNLKNENFETRCAYNGREGLELAKKLIPDFIVLDIMLPDLNGLELCKNLKKDPRTQKIPILFLTAKSEEIDRVIGFELGADDYLTKPFSPRELILRIKAIIKRSQSTESSSENTFQFGMLSVDVDKFEVKVKNELVRLTALELKLLHFLYQNRGRVASRETLLDKVWGYDADLYTRTVDTYVKRLREKLGEAGKYIETIRSMGYRFREDPEKE